MRRVPSLLVLELRQARIERGLTQQDVARLAQLTKTSLGYYERGQKQPSLPALSRWAGALGLAVTVTPATASTDETEPEL